MVEGIEATYMDFTRRTAKYPKRSEKEYLMIGLMNEAGEVGVAVGGISNAAAKKRVIPNLYELAAAISSTTGMTKHELGAD